MLISHIHKFLYLKTHKTASTSVEGLLEMACSPPGHQPQYMQSEIISEWGYVSGRNGGGTLNDFLPAHAPAELVKKNIGDAMFDDYLKIYVIRNPYDKVVSWFWHVMPADTRQRLGGDFTLARQLFHDWLRMRPQLNVDQQYYRTRGGPFEAIRLRYEHLPDDLRSLGETLNLDLDLGMLPDWQRGSRRHKARPYQDYYESDTKAVVDKWFSYDFENFDYPRTL